MLDNMKKKVNYKTIALFVCFVYLLLCWSMAIIHTEEAYWIFIILNYPLFYLCNEGLLTLPSFGNYDMYIASLLHAVLIYYLIILFIGIASKIRKK